MLTRATRKHNNRRLLRQYLLAEYSQLTPPWLCPALNNHCPNRRRESATLSKTQTARSGPQNTPRTLPGTRKFATAVDSYPSSPVHESIPFEGFSALAQHGRPPGSASRGNVNNTNFSSPIHFDPSNIVVLPHESIPANLKFKSSRRLGVPSELSELQQILYACVQVGRMDRAATLTRRITDMYTSTTPQVYDAHQRYLSGCLDSLLRSPSQDKLVAMQRWLELDMRARDVPVGHGVIATMLKATLATLVGSRSDRTIRRYITFARSLGPETYYNTLASSIFTAAEINKILRLFPQEFEAPSEELSEADIEELERAQKAANAKPLPLEPESSGSSMNFEPLPELKSVEQKGLGLDTVKRSLGSLSEDYLHERNHEDLNSQLERQEKLEQDVLDAAIERWRKESEDFNFQAHRAKGQLQFPPLGAQVHEWVNLMTTDLKAELKRAEELETQTESNDNEYDIMIAAPFLKLLVPEKACATTVMSFFNVIMDPRLMRNSREHKVPVVRFCEQIGTTLLSEARMQKIQTHHLQSLSGLPSAERRKRLAKLMKGKKRSSRSIDLEYAKVAQQSDTPIPLHNYHVTSIRVGAVMLGLFLKVAQVTKMTEDPDTGIKTPKTQPVAVRDSEWRKGKKLGVLSIAIDLYLQLKKEPASNFIAKQLPMVAPPRPWTSLTTGAYYKTSENVVRFRDMGATQKSYLKLADQRGDLKHLYAGLDVISSTPWRVNKDLLRVMMEVWNSGQGLGKIVPAALDIAMPPRPDTDDPQVLNRWKYVCKSVQNEINANHSQRCYQNFQLEIARAFSNTTFYCPQNVDFRGRAYPISPYFNHTGADHVRSLFTFAQGKELGETGLFWLKVQLANVFGYDKESLTARAAFVDEHRAEIYDSVNNPLNGGRWWLQAGDPWQCLAACMELKNALDSPMPTKFVSHLPVQQDGSCNGLQHYAALGGDEIGARQVNLTPGDKPADVYSAVASLVKEMVHADAEKGNVMARVLDGHVNRKMVKQPVMTNVYGVTYHGAAQQVERQLREILPEQKSSMDVNTTTHKLGAYVATCIFKALREMFTGAQAIQLWLGECGGRISSAVTPEQIERTRDQRVNGPPTLEQTKGYRKDQILKGRKVWHKDSASFKSTIVWTTPLGMPVVQPYREFRKKVIDTHLQYIVLYTPTANDPVSKRKQLQAFPPNFIHSLDATHMLLSALKCNEIGLQFGSVHDSFWTHACDVPTLNRVLRDAFVTMHHDDIVKRLKEEFEVRYKGCLQWISVSLKSPLGRKLMQYFRETKHRRQKEAVTSRMINPYQVDDLLEESQRQTLLASSDPAERDKGKAMVTAASIVEAHGASDNEVYSTMSWGRQHGGEPEHETPSVKETAPSPSDGLADAPEVTPTPEATDEIFGADTEFDSADAADEDEDAAHPEVDEAWIETVAADAAEEAKKTTTTTTEKKKAAQDQRDRHRVYFWMPLRFPNPPEKGAFDVTSLRESQYFFS